MESIEAEAGTDAAAIAATVTRELRLAQPLIRSD